jgi:hypothetical protein
LSQLGDMGNQACAASNDVAQLTHDPNPQIAKMAAETLDKIGK